MPEPYKPVRDLNAPPRPVRVAENPFGDFSEEQLAGPTLQDRFFIKGYSDKRHERELAIREGRKPGTLKHRFQFVSVERADGKPRREKEFEWRSRGYRPVLWDEAAALGLDLENSSAIRSADGTVRVDTQMLMVTDAENAARQYKDARDRTERMYRDKVKGRMDDAVQNYNARHGHTEQSGTRAFHEESIVEKGKSPFDIE